VLKVKDKLELELNLVLLDNEVILLLLDDELDVSVLITDDKVPMLLDEIIITVLLDERPDVVLLEALVGLALILDETVVPVMKLGTLGFSVLLEEELLVPVLLDKELIDVLEAELLRELPPEIVWLAELDVVSEGMGQGVPVVKVLVNVAVTNNVDVCTILTNYIDGCRNHHLLC
jgi:hypothetical protein